MRLRITRSENHKWMINELKKVERLLFEHLHLPISNVTQDKESRAYFGCSFQIDKLNFTFRKAKITPKKAGQFVTLWKRDSHKITQPFRESDDFGFYIIAAQENEKYGLFLFPKSELSKRHILTSIAKEGKRGFRIYPGWTNTGNKQAEKTQSWQTKYFIDFTTYDLKNREKITSIMLV